MRFTPPTFRLLTIFACALTAGRAPGADLECRWAETAPVIDGRGDDSIWQHASVSERFVRHWVPGAPASKEGTRVRLLWDREGIYFFAELDDTDVTADVREHDGPMWKNDVFEIFLKPSEAHTGYYEFEVNPFAAVLDAFFPDAASRKAEQLREGRFHVEAKVVVRDTLNESGDRDTGWTVEGRIPWSDFAPTGGRPGPGETWRVNLTRVNGTGPAQELSSVAPLTQPSFHRTRQRDEMDRGLLALRPRDARRSACLSDLRLGAGLGSRRRRPDPHGKLRCDVGETGHGVKRATGSGC